MMIKLERFRFVRPYRAMAEGKGGFNERVWSMTLSLMRRSKAFLASGNLEDRMPSAINDQSWEPLGKGFRGMMNLPDFLP